MADITRHGSLTEKFLNKHLNKKGVNKITNKLDDLSGTTKGFEGLGAAGFGFAALAGIGVPIRLNQGEGLGEAVGKEILEDMKYTMAPELFVAEMGKIATMTQGEDKSQSPLQSELQSVANKIAVFAVIVALGIFGISIYQGYGLDFALIYALGIAVAVVPQALPMQVTVALSQGVNRLAGKNAVVKKLSSAETLGSTNVICTDKTGTVTKNEMPVKKV
jgi:high-affinity K+ transport system ATPase subunit B